MANNTWEIDTDDMAFSGETTISHYGERYGYVFVFVAEENVIVLYRIDGDSEAQEISNARCRWISNNVRKCVALAACMHDVPHTSDLIRVFNENFEKNLNKRR